MVDDRHSGKGPAPPPAAADANPLNPTTNEYPLSEVEYGDCQTRWDDIYKYFHLNIHAHAN